MAGKSAPSLSEEEDDEFAVQVNMDKVVSPATKGEILYRFRTSLRDEGMCDDYVVLEFDPAKVDYAGLSSGVFAQYLALFDAYRGHVGPLQFRVIDFDSTRKLNLRHTVSRIYPLTFLDNELCVRNFSLTPSEIANRLQNHVEQVHRLDSGILIVASSKILSINESDTLNGRIMKLLRSSQNRPC